MKRRPARAEGAARPSSAPQARGGRATGEARRERVGSGAAGGARAAEAVALPASVVAARASPCRLHQGLQGYEDVLDLENSYLNASPEGEQMGSEGVEADIVTRNIMIHGLCKDRRTKETAQFHRDIVAAVVETNTTLVNGYCRAGDVGEAIRMQGADGDVGFCIK
ncbi:hypothetical protein ACQ4PT_071495 [Festuca glaucescens]